MTLDEAIARVKSDWLRRSQEIKCIDGEPVKRDDLEDMSLAYAMGWADAAEALRQRLIGLDAQDAQKYSVAAVLVLDELSERNTETHPLNSEGGAE